MRYFLIVLWMMLCSITSATAQVSIGIGLPGVSIGINVPVYPQLVRVPAYPVYYAPRVSSNYFFYDGMYWVYQQDNWYASSWYNGPWGLVAPEVVPVYILRVPVRYYRQPPAYFYGWRSDAPPRWGDHWGNQWEQERSGWDRWNSSSAPAPAPLPVYQRQYSGDRYPQLEQQRTLHGQEYRYQPRDAVVRQYYQDQAVQIAPAFAQQINKGRNPPSSLPPARSRRTKGRNPPSSLPLATARTTKRHNPRSSLPLATARTTKRHNPRSSLPLATARKIRGRNPPRSLPLADKGKGYSGAL
jgi:hypothetical protein